MDSQAFDACKRDCLRKMAEADKSPKGGLDAPIVPLIHAINRHPDYVTTSSCSGRIALFAGAYVAEGEEGEGEGEGDDASNLREADEEGGDEPSVAGGAAPAARSGWPTCGSRTACTAT